MRVGSLFSGIGGIDLGLERAGMRVVWQSEIDPYASKVLARHWPGVPNLGDITAIDWGEVRDKWGEVDVLCGGFPCQPVSVAGQGKGQGDKRWLWPEYARAIRSLRPRYVLIENVPGLLTSNSGREAQAVFGSLSEYGYDAEWASVPAAAFGAPHLRYRVVIVAYSPESGLERPGQGLPGQGSAAVAHPERPRRDGLHERVEQGHLATDVGVSGADSTGRPATEDYRRAVQGPRSKSSEDVAYSNQVGWAGGARVLRPPGRGQSANSGEDVPDDDSQRVEGPGTQLQATGVDQCFGGDWWATEPDVGRVAYGVASRVDRLKCLGNAVVPQMAEWVGNLILDHAACTQPPNGARPERPSWENTPTAKPVKPGDEKECRSTTGGELAGTRSTGTC